MKANVIACANAKGGIGKTTTALGLSYALSHLGFNVLVIDGDPQASATNNLGIDNENEYNLNNLIAPVVEVKLGEFSKKGYKSASDYWNAIRIESYSWDRVKKFIFTPTYQKMVKRGMNWEKGEFSFGDELGKFDIIPSSINLSMIDLEMGMASKYFKVIYTGYILDFIKVIDMQEIYDYIILDLPPQISSLSNNLIAAAKSGVILCSNLDIQSIRGFDSIIEAIDANLQNDAEHRGILGILFSMYSERRKIDQDIEDIAKDYIPIPVLDTKIPETSDVRKAYSNGRLVNQINKKAEEAYKQLAKEIHYAMLYPDNKVGSNKQK